VVADLARHCAAVAAGLLAPRPMTVCMIRFSAFGLQRGVLEFWLLRSVPHVPISTKQHRQAPRRRRPPRRKRNPAAVLNLNRTCGFREISGRTEIKNKKVRSCWWSQYWYFVSSLFPFRFSFLPQSPEPVVYLATWFGPAIVNMAGRSF
jgi:hypothetical protein